MQHNNEAHESQAGGSEWELSEAIKLMGEAQASGDPEQIATAMRRHAEALTNVTNTVMIPTLQNVLETVVKKEVGALAPRIDATAKEQERRFTYLLTQMQALLDKEDARHAVYDQEQARQEQLLTQHLDAFANQIGGLRGDTLALQAEFRRGLSGIQTTVSALTETVDDLQAQMRDSQNDRADLRQRIDAISTSQAVFTASMLLSDRAVIVIDMEQIIASVNAKACTYFGYTADELLGRPLDVLIPKRFRAIHRAHIEAFAASNDTQRLMADRHAVYGLHKDGTEFPIRAAIVKVSNGFTAVVERSD